MSKNYLKSPNINKLFSMLLSGSDFFNTKNESKFKSSLEFLNAITVKHLFKITHKTKYMFFIVSKHIICAFSSKSLICFVFFGLFEGHYTKIMPKKNYGGYFRDHSSQNTGAALIFKTGWACSQSDHQLIIIDEIDWNLYFESNKF